MVPLLTVYADLMGMLGGAAIGVTMLDVFLKVDFHQLQEALSLKYLAQGLIKSAVYGVIIALAGRMRGMQSGVLFQNGGLWSSMTLAENVALPLQRYTALSPSRIGKVMSLKLALVGLGGLEELYPSEISGGMQKHAGLAWAMALDPDILFFDEPSAGLDPISSRRLAELILELRDSLGATVGVGMGKRVNPTVIGAFIVGAVALIVQRRAGRYLALGTSGRSGNRAAAR